MIGFNKCQVNKGQHIVIVEEFNFLMFDPEKQTNWEANTCHACMHACRQRARQQWWAVHSISCEYCIDVLKGDGGASSLVPLPPKKASQDGRDATETCRLLQLSLGFCNEGTLGNKLYIQFLKKQLKSSFTFSASYRRIRVVKKKKTDNIFRPKCHWQPLSTI